MSQQNLVDWKPEYKHDNILEHPIKICQTLSISCVKSPDISYTLKNDYGNNLSTFQVETVSKIISCIMKKKPFLLGDGTGVGKGRVLAAVVNELDQNTLWISSSMKLEKSAQMELDIVSDNKKFENVKFSSYTSVKYKLKELKEFVSKRDTFIILDECHQMRNCSKTKKIVDILLAKSSKICYSSATIASSIRHLPYLEGLKLWGEVDSPFASWEQLYQSSRTDTSALLELISLHLCRNGQYVCRQLDTKNVNFTVQNIVIEKKSLDVYDKFAKELFHESGKIRQHLFLRLITYLKVKETIKIVEEYLEKGCSIVISVSNTGEASLKRSKENGSYITYLQEVCDKYGIDLEFNLEAIDVILHHFGSNNVSEITGRKMRPNDLKNKFERVPRNDIESFKNNTKKIAILSKAGGMGLSLHDSTGHNPRVHIILEIPWSGEDFLQQMGRIYRSNAQSIPSYVFIVSQIPSEKRMILGIVKKLKSMGAIVKADRNAYEIPGLKEESIWSSQTKGNTGLQLALAKHNNIIHDTYNVDFLRIQKSAAHLKTSIIQNLSISDEIEDLHTPDSNYEMYTHNLSLAKNFFPSIYNSVVQSWTPENHILFNSSFKRRVLYFLMCAKVSPYLNMLGDNLLTSIIEFMADVYEPTKLNTIGNWMHIKYAKMSSCSQEQIMNDCLSMPVQLQSCFLDLINSNYFDNVKTSNIITINQYADELVGSKHIKSYVEKITEIEYENVSHKIKIKYEIIPQKTPIENAEFWQSLCGKRILWRTISGEYECLDGGNCIFDENKYKKCNDERWYKMLEKRNERLKKICTQTPTIFYISAENALSCWSSSLKKTIRFTNNNVNVVGVLIDIMS